MASITRQRTVTAPPDRVWEVLADFGAISSWAPNVDHSCLLEHGGDPVAVGTTRRVQAGRDTLVERISESIAPRVLAYDIEGLPRRLGRVGNRWQLAAGPDAAPSREYTTVTLTSTVQTGGNPLAWAVEQAACRLLARQSETMLAGLAARVEGTRVEDTA